MIKEIKLTILLLSISLIGFGQALPKEKSKNHIQIKGTNIFMIPPVSFESSDNFKGLQNSEDQTTMIMVIEIPGPYSEVSKGFNSEMLKPKGMELKSLKKVKVADYDGLLIELDQPANGLIFSKQILVYGNEKSSTLINGVYQKDSLQLGKRIKESILTTFVDSELESNPREALNYTLNENAGSLKFHSVIGNGMLFNRDLKTPTESADKATLITDKSFSNIEISNKKLFCISRLKKYPEDYSVILSKGINEIELDKLKGYELFAKNNDRESEEMYQVILFDDNGGYYLFVGTYLAGSKNAITDIKKIIETFKSSK
ncbi:hypothetical protein [Pontibacter sp. HSC-36F09]|uniref:hypothetical protein n=1 Tax=Pontibacter sp. HSC-36F09 TaxID=2910966 RepID=UPI00209CBBEB|nr:hypothetical protein [Pontibacter sp. HSC-36F09]MCP2042648.1 hypothetical protein [Pontibacter sp. HSC-36F09]